MHLLLRSALPAELDPEPPRPREANPAAIDRALRRTIKWWRAWARSGRIDSPESAGVQRSAMVLKALSYAPTGAILGAPTTSLPEQLRGSANWDYRYSWIRDSTLAARSLAELGHVEEADAFRSFIVRSAAGHAGDLQVMYGPGGERRLDEQELDLEGYRRSRPVRVGNAAAEQLQLDAYGELVNLYWRWHRRGHSPDDDDWTFVTELVETAIQRWQEPDCGIWEARDRRRHFVHSKVLCWSAADRGLALSKECRRKAPVKAWRKARAEIREAVETRGYDDRRGVFVQAFGSKTLDASVLLLPTLDFCAWDDERMIRTTDAIRADLDDHGLIQRSGGRGKPSEGAFLACSFWLSEALAYQGRRAEAREVFDRAVTAANELGLMSEEANGRTGTPLGNYPQGISHLSHIAAALALAR
jgi:GH15 family glucan-1,4-alpha-glucosidase